MAPSYPRKTGSAKSPQLPGTVKVAVLNARGVIISVLDMPEQVKSP